ncbi:MAG: YbjN domain-containing protein [Caulobacterales bacterium]
MKHFIGLAALAAGAFLATSAMAFKVTDGGITAQEVAQVLQDKGYKAEVTTDDEGDPKVKSATDGTNFTIFFYGCNHGPRCASVTFQAAFHVEGGLTAERINDWNKDKRFLKGWLDKVNDPFVEMDLDVEHGFLTEGLANNVDTWAAMLPEFKKFIGFE